MQLSGNEKNIRVTLHPQISTVVENPRSMRKTVLSTLLALLLLCSALFGSVAVFVSLEGPNYLRDYALDFLAKNNENLSDEASLERKYNEDTLSYFSPTEIGKLGILALPKNFKVQEEYKGIKLVQSETEKFTETQLGLLKMFIDMTPKKLLTPGPTAIITFTKGEIKQGTNFNPNTAAFASGTYVFFNDTSFDPNSPLADDSVDASYNTFIHELTHVSQFNEITKDISLSRIESYYQSGLSWIDLVMSSELIADFAEDTGWEKQENDGKINYVLTDTAEKTSLYGKSKIYEDMAETVAGSVVTESSEFSQSRQSWALKFLNETTTSLAAEKLPFSPSLEQVRANNLQYDSSKDAIYTNAYNHSNKQVFLTQKLNTIDEIHSFYNTELAARGWKGSFKKTVDVNGVIRYKGEFEGKYRDMYIEIYSYDKAKGYLVKPHGTILVVISGYIQKQSVGQD